MAKVPGQGWQMTRAWENAVGQPVAETLPVVAFSEGEPWTWDPDQGVAWVDQMTVVWHPDINDGDGTWSRSRAERRAIRLFNEKARRSA